jgi:hypothetical protein
MLEAEVPVFPGIGVWPVGEDMAEVFIADFAQLINADKALLAIIPKVREWTF